MKWRADRYPSGWAMDVNCSGGEFPVKVVNVSTSGLKFSGDVQAGVDDPVRFRVLGQRIGAKLARRDTKGGALKFDRALTPAQLATLRQFRSMGGVW
ncbi:hypothetical protein [Tropicibacter alexandrii]|uniref:hypothetical protein n=1 Tax=Tropicibacter alexandrii TaxID=2267683 RepID=UPI000EF4F48B|nr:hypothetical protein [Tropicibacter alexandrii]